MRVYECRRCLFQLLPASQAGVGWAWVGGVYCSNQVVCADRRACHRRIRHRVAGRKVVPTYL